MKALKGVFKSIIALALIIILSLANYAWAQDSIPKNEDAIIESFNSTGAQFIQTNANCNGKIVDKFLNMESLLQIGEFVIKDLEILGKPEEKKVLVDISELNEGNSLINETYYIIKNDSKENRQVTYWGNDKEGRLYTIILTSEMDPFSDFQQTNIFVDVIDNKGICTIKATNEKIKELFRKFNIEAEISTCIIGAFEGQLSSKERINKMATAIGKISGSKVEGLFESSIISVSVYTPNIENYIFTGNNKMNLNISMRYNEYEEKTYIWMGTPIITIGY